MKYSPDQARAPAGNPDGGQWVSEGEGADLGAALPGSSRNAASPAAAQPTERQKQLVNGVNPENGGHNCVAIAEAVIARATGKDANAVAANEGDVSEADAEKRLGTKFVRAKGGIEGVYNTVKSGGDGTVAVMTVMDPETNHGHIVTVYNDHGKVGFIEGQDWGGGKGSGVITSVKAAKERYDLGAKTVVKIGIVKP